MSPGTLLFGIAVAVAVAAYVARPFRRAPDDLDQLIETWVAEEARRLPDRSPSSAAHVCPQCGRRVKPTHRFCRNCGAVLPPKHTKDVKDDV